VNDPSSISSETWIERSLGAMAIARRLGAMVERQLHAVGLSEPAAALLWACATAPAEGLDQRALADRLAVSPAQVSVQVERLARRGFLQCHMAEGDRRRRLWQFTPDGAALWADLRETCRLPAQQRGAA
jgi:DNA-binding MarR family transcriptional regulator